MGRKLMVVVSERKGDRHRGEIQGERPCGHRGRDWSDMHISLGMPGVASSPGSWAKMQIHLQAHITLLKAPPQFPVV